MTLVILIRSNQIFHFLNLTISLDLYICPMLGVFFFFFNIAFLSCQAQGQSRNTDALNISGLLFGSAGRESTCNEGDLGLIPGLGRSPGEGKGYPLQYSGLENSMDHIVHYF